MAPDGCTMSVLAVVLCLVVPLCQAGGHIEIFVIKFQTSCTDNSFFNTACDTYFNFCIDRPGALNFGSCDYRHFGPSSHYENTNSYQFGSSIGGISNPMVVNTAAFQTFRVQFGVQMYDDEAIQSDELLVTMSKTVPFTPALTKAAAEWKHSYMHQSHYQVWFRYRAYCDAHYYTVQCEVYCRARDDDEGHYTCNVTTGAKKCMRGWTGENCNVDINECEQGPCFNNVQCTNMPGSYHCQCPNGLTGQDCNLIDSLCHSQPCLHNGTCTGSMTSYTCNCPVEWTGTNCQEQVDFCQSNPCQNNASCYGSVGSFACVCDAGWTGNMCTTQVHACDNSPCQNGATCTNLPRAEYQCTCSNGFEGSECQLVINPCDPSPCNNSGTCTSPTYDNYSCSCVEGWSGQDCNDYIIVETEEQRQGETKDESVHWLPIVLAIVATLVIATCILILLYIRRRKRQQKAMTAHLTDEEHLGDHVVHVVGQDNLAYRNALYDNQANCNLDRRAQMPVPTAAAGTDEFYPVKGKELDGDEHLGAVGGANPYHDIDGDLGPTKCDVTSRQKQTAGQLDTRTMAGGQDQQGGVNDYADFRELQRRSMTARQASADTATTDSTENTTISPNFMEARQQPEENHYHDIDDLTLEFADNSTVPSASPPGTGALSHYDLPPRHRHDESPGTVQAPGEGYMSMAGSTSRPTSQPTEPERIESTDDESDAEGIVRQEDIDQLRREVLQGSTC